ncbi:hypothetical protein FGU71_04165 [Erythrobacter insulae]|uniref:Uncharacterized protein n=1 Tax=Erythrobacter insulae TaxID=2584124 RepID=A0A547PAR6_9SPHN|nr:hypothetical protein [Erythrobacter insulae]TRD11124.1 hypothetical protein FGU71_04165 [Erythrobacter insulae]
MKALAGLALAGLLAGCAGPAGTGSIRPGMPVIAADIAQNRLAQDEGVLTALRQTASPGAIVFAPGPVDAQKWLGEQSGFPESAWQGHLVAVSCDGSLGAVTGAIQWDGQPGYYTTIWRYEQGEDEGRNVWRWIVSHGDGLDRARPAPQLPLTQAASCENLPALSGPTAQSGRSADGSLRYNWAYTPEQGRVLTIDIWDGTEFRTVIEDKVPSGQPE